jgi:hypothetical protein
MPMADSRIRPDMSIIYAMLAVIVSCCLVVSGEFFLKPRMSQIMAEIKLNELQTAFQTLQHPQDSQLVSEYSLTGEFTGGKPGCDYFIGEIRSVPSETQNLQTTYAGQEIDGRPFEIALLEDTASIPEQLQQLLPEALSDLQAWQPTPNAQPGQSTYIIYLLLIDDEKEYDCR